MKRGVVPVFSVLLLSIAVSSCSNQTEGSKSDDSVLQVIPDTHTTLSIEPAPSYEPVLPVPAVTFYEKNYKVFSEADLIGNRPLKSYLEDPSIPQKFKDVFTTQGDSLGTDEASLAIIDSLFSVDAARKPFYFLLYTHCMWWADTQMAEQMSSASERYATNRTQELLDYFSNNQLTTVQDYYNWAESIAMGLSLLGEGVEETPVEQLTKQMEENTEPSRRNEVRAFTDKVSSYIP